MTVRGHGSYDFEPYPTERGARRGEARRIQAHDSSLAGEKMAGETTSLQRELALVWADPWGFYGDMIRQSGAWMYNL